jgi:hypothetical protein
MGKKKVIAITAPVPAVKAKPVMTAERRAALAEKARKQWADKNSKLRANASEKARRQWADKDGLLRKNAVRMKHPPKDAVDRIEHCVATYGSTREQLAQHFKIHIDTFDQWLKRHPEIRDAYERSKGIEYSQLTGMLYQKAMQGDSVCAMFLLKIRHGARDNGPIPGQVTDPASSAARIRAMVQAMEKANGDGE